MEQKNQPKKYKFKIGDKVRVVINNDNTFPEGSIVYVAEESACPFVTSEYIGHFSNDREEGVKTGCFNQIELELIEEKRNRGGEGIGPSKASESQVDGNHYSKLKIQPIEYCFKNNLNVCQSKAIKYITRYKSKGTPLKDLEKAIHCLQLLIELEELKDE